MGDDDQDGTVLGALQHISGRLAAIEDRLADLERIIGVPPTDDGDDYR